MEESSWTSRKACIFHHPLSLARWVKRQINCKALLTIPQMLCKSSRSSPRTKYTSTLLILRHLHPRSSARGGPIPSRAKRGSPAASIEASNRSQSFSRPLQTPMLAQKLALPPKHPTTLPRPESSMRRSERPCKISWRRLSWSSGRCISSKKDYASRRRWRRWRVVEIEGVR
jgi:hypothetical protein